jgi:hypothetical protein
VLVAILEHFSHRQDTKNAKKTVMSPRKALGDFNTSLATFASLAVQKTTLKRETISFYA